MKYFLAGLGLGTALGICLAPSAGGETRKKVKQWGADLAQRLDKQPNVADEQDGASIQAESHNAEQEKTAAPDPVAEVLNNASKTKLRSVSGIGEATARRIIENRPFENEAEVVENNVMPEKVLKTLKDKLVDTEEGAA
jgi:DNA uptake protein ComE-like DNA-binding protein